MCESGGFYFKLMPRCRAPHLNTKFPGRIPGAYTPWVLATFIYKTTVLRQERDSHNVTCPSLSPASALAVAVFDNMFHT